MHVGTYPTRNFATLGPLWLQPPFAGTYIQNLLINLLINFSFLSYSTGQVSDPILSNYTLQSPVFLLNSRHPLFRDTLIFIILKHSFSRSYRVNLPSSFNIVISYTLVYSTYSPVSVLVRSFQFIAFSRNFLNFYIIYLI